MKKKTLQILIIMAFIPLILVIEPNKSAFAIDYTKVTGATVSASSQDPSYPVSNAIDSNISTYWMSTTTTFAGTGSLPTPVPYPSESEYVQYHLSSPKVVTMYRFHLPVPAVNNGSGISIALKASNDGSYWTTLHYSTSTFVPNQWHEFNFSNSTPYTYYRFYANTNPECAALPPIWWQCFYTLLANEVELYTDPCNPSGTLEGLYECDGYMETDGIVEPGTSATFLSSQSITLKPGFWAKAGSTFSASLNLDSDDDSIPDYWESLYGLNPYLNDASIDSDNDGLTNLQEYLLGTSPINSDTDGDGMPDNWEVQYGLDPNNSADASQDLDGDYISNLKEYLSNTDPTVASKGAYYEYDELGRIKSITRIK